MEMAYCWQMGGGWAEDAGAGGGPGSWPGGAPGRGRVRGPRSPHACLLPASLNSRLPTRELFFLYFP